MKSKKNKKRKITKEKHLTKKDHARIKKYWEKRSIKTQSGWGLKTYKVKRIKLPPINIKINNKWLTDFSLDELTDFRNNFNPSDYCDFDMLNLVELVEILFKIKQGITNGIGDELMGETELIKKYIIQPATSTEDSGDILK